MASVRDGEPTAFSARIIEVNAKGDELPQDRVIRLAIYQTVSFAWIPDSVGTSSGWDGNDDILVRRYCPVRIRALVEEQSVDRKRGGAKRTRREPGESRFAKQAADLG